MLDKMIVLIIGLIVLGILWWAVSILPLPGLIAQILQVVFVLAVALFVVDWLLGVAGRPRPWR